MLKKKNRKHVERHSPKAQPRIPGERKVPTPSSLQREIRRRVEDDALRFGVSRSWVVATALAAVYGIEIIGFDGRETRSLQLVKGSRRR